MELDPHPQAPLLQPLPRPSIPDPRLQVTLSLPQISIRRRPPSTTLTIDEIELLPPSCSPPALCAPSEPTTPCLGFCRTAHRLAGPATTGRQSTAKMEACPAATTARVGAAHDGGLWRRSGRSPSVLARPARGRSTTTRVSELQHLLRRLHLRHPAGHARRRRHPGDFP
ncbi:uncharacterized protein [Triticum aestivum]|uniref:uncharacterized protein isoform X2 n=1 Tax=Triticum aestivum TaxID=4565 RepID=UPI001D0279C8|nr:uncharacterized protein LOC123066202 isoform X2 [Triticum aestivum]